MQDGGYRMSEVMKQVICMDKSNHSPLSKASDMKLWVEIRLIVLSKKKFNIVTIQKKIDSSNEH